MKHCILKLWAKTHLSPFSWFYQGTLAWGNRESNYDTASSKNKFFKKLTIISVYWREYKARYNQRVEKEHTTSLDGRFQSVGIEVQTTFKPFGN